MCFGGGQRQPAPPQVRYVGPSDADFKRNEEAMQVFQQQLEQQQTDFEKALQKQIDTANADFAKLEETYADEISAAQTTANNAVSAAKQSGAADLSAAAAGGALVQSGAYKVGTQQSDPVNAETTKAITDKKKPKSSLKINTGGTQASAGTGLNIGV